LSLIRVSFLEVHPYLGRDISATSYFSGRVVLSISEAVRSFGTLLSTIGGTTQSDSFF